MMQSVTEAGWRYGLIGCVWMAGLAAATGQVAAKEPPVQVAPAIYRVVRPEPGVATPGDAAADRPTPGLTADDELLWADSAAGPSASTGLEAQVVRWRGGWGYRGWGGWGYRGWGGGYRGYGWGIGPGWGGPGYVRPYRYRPFVYRPYGGYANWGYGFGAPVVYGGFANGGYPVAVGPYGYGGAWGYPAYGVPSYPAFGFGYGYRW